MSKISKYFVKCKYSRQIIGLTFAVIFTLLACSQEVASEKAEIDEAVIIKADIENANTIDLQSIVDSFTIISLTPPEQYILGEAVKIIEGHYGILISDSRQQLSYFTSDGSWVYTINAKGKGPGEYIDISDFTVSSNKEIFILDTNQRKVIKYNLLSGKYLTEYSLNIVPRPLGFEYTEKNSFIFYCGIADDQDATTQYHFFETNETFDMLVEKYMPYQKGTSVNFLPQRGIQRVENRIHLLPIYEQTIFELDNSSLHPIYTLDLGNRYNINKQKLLNEPYTSNYDWIVINPIQDQIYFLNYFESNKFQYFYFYVNNEYIYILYDKRSKKSIIFKDVKGNYLSFDLKPITVNDEGMYLDLMPYSVFKDGYNALSIDKRNILQLEFSTLDPDRTSILLKVKFRNL